jgi:hypothetical protein
MFQAYSPYPVLKFPIPANQLPHGYRTAHAKQAHAAPVFPNRRIVRVLF